MKDTFQHATHPAEVIDAIALAICRIPPTELYGLPMQLTPRRLHSREDLEHWSRRLANEEVGAHPAGRFLRGLFKAGLARLDEIGPARVSSHQTGAPVNRGSQAAGRAS